MMVYMDCGWCGRHGMEIIRKIRKNLKHLFSLIYICYILTQLGTQPVILKAKLSSVERSSALCCVWGINMYKVIEPLTGVKLQTLSS